MKNQTPETEMKLKEIPMLTADGHAIKLNDILLRSHYTRGYRFEAKTTAKIEPLRVFFVNNTTRTFRVRCKKGCEETFQIGNGCTTRKLFAKLDSVKKEIKKHLDEDLKNCKKKELNIKKTRDSVIKEYRKINALKKLDLPKEVK